MGIEIVGKSGRLLTVKVSGTLTPSEVRQAQKAAIGIITTEGTVRVLVLGEHFEGWSRSKDWDDVGFQLKYDEKFERMAIVGAEKWEELASAFVGKGLRQVDIRFFPRPELAKARAWLA